MATTTTTSALRFGDVIDLDGVDAEVDFGGGDFFTYRVAGSEKFEASAHPDRAWTLLRRTC